MKRDLLRIGLIWLAVAVGVVLSAATVHYGLVKP
jgi:hypothetical protein